MVEVTDLQVLAKMAEGTPNEEDAFEIKNKKTDKIITSIHNLQELVTALSTIDAKDLHSSIYHKEENGDDFVCNLALWVHYILGDAVLSARIYHLVKELHEEPEELRIELFNVIFNRYLNYLEITDYANELLPINDKKNNSHI
jgi:hypothetical protein